MSWKDNLPIKTCDGFAPNSTIESYLRKMDFYESTMNPRFINNYNYCLIKNHGVKCLRSDFDYKDNSDWTLRIFVSQTEVYVEVQGGYRNFEFSNHSILDKNISIEEFDEILDMLTNS